MSGATASAAFGIAAGLALLAAVGLAAWIGRRLHGRRSRALGRAEAEGEMQRKVLDNVEKAALARDRLRGDPGAARRLRERFTRGG